LNFSQCWRDGNSELLQYADALMSLHQPFISDHSRLNCSSFANLAIKLLKTSFFFTLERRKCFRGFFLGTRWHKRCVITIVVCPTDRPGRPRATPMRTHIKRLIVIAQRFGYGFGFRYSDPSSRFPAKRAKSHLAVVRLLSVYLFVWLQFCIVANTLAYSCGYVSIILLCVLCVLCVLAQNGSHSSIVRPTNFYVIQVPNNVTGNFQ